MCLWVLIWRSYLSWEQIALVSSIGLFVQLLLELPSGALADLWGRKNTILFGRAIGVLGFAILTIADSFWLFTLGNILYLSNWAFESGALSALLFDSLKENGVGEHKYQSVQANTFSGAPLVWQLVAPLVAFSILFIPNSHMPQRP